MRPQIAAGIALSRALHGPALLNRSAASICQRAVRGVVRGRGRRGQWRLAPGLGSAQRAGAAVCGTRGPTTAPCKVYGVLARPRRRLVNNPTHLKDRTGFTAMRQAVDAMGDFDWDGGSDDDDGSDGSDGGSDSASSVGSAHVTDPQASGKADAADKADS